MLKALIFFILALVLFIADLILFPKNIYAQIDHNINLFSDIFPALIVFSVVYYLKGVIF